MMSKLKFLSGRSWMLPAVACGLLFAACNGGELTPEGDAGENGPELKPNTIVPADPTKGIFIAAMEDGCLCDGWKAGDAVSVFADESSAVNMRYDVSQAGSATILKGDKFDPEKVYYAVSPWSEDNSFDYASKSFYVSVPPQQSGSAAGVVVGATEGKDAALTFHYPFARIYFEVAEDNVETVVISADQEGVILTGDVEVLCSLTSAPELSLVDQTGGSTITIPVNGAKGIFYAEVLPQTAEITLTMKMLDATQNDVIDPVSSEWLTLARNQACTLRGLVAPEEINTPEDFKNFLACAARYTEEDVIPLRTDIDLGGMELRQGASFSGTLDGQNRNITNLKADKALFAELTGTVKDLVIDASCSLSVESEGDVAFIALDNKGIISNCINNAGITVQDAGTAETPKYVGAFAARSTGSIVDCVNSGPVSVTYGSGSRMTFVGGIVGQAGGTTADAEFISGCQNNGTVAFDAAAYSCKLFIGGVLGGTPVGNKTDGFGYYGVVKNCTNNAAVSVSCDDYSSENNYLNLGGVVGYAEADVDNCDNSGAVTVSFQTEPSSADYNYLRPAVGGVAGDVLYDVTNCDNTGTLTVTGAFASTANKDAGEGQDGFASFGGVVAIAGSSANDHKVTACTNSGAMNLDIHMFNSAKSHGNIGGVVGNAIAAVSDCQNSGAGLTVKNRMRGGRVGGVVGITNAAVENSDNSAPIDYDMVVTAENGNQSKYVDLGGVVGQLNSKASEAITFSANTGNITVKNGWKSGEISTIGGLIGRNATGRVLGGKTKNDAKESIQGTYTITSPATIYFGGIVGGMMGSVSSSSKGLYNFERRGMSVVTDPGEGSRIGAICGARFNATQADASVNLVASADEFTCSSAATDIYAGLFYGEYTTSAADMYVHTCTLNAGSPVVTNMTACGIAVGKLTSGTMLLGKVTNKFTIRPLTFNGKTYSAGYDVTESDLKGAGDGTVSTVNVVVAK